MQQEEAKDSSQQPNKEQKVKGKKPTLKQKTMVSKDKANVTLEEKINQMEINMRYRMAALCTQLFGAKYYLSLVKNKEEFAAFVKPFVIQQSQNKLKQKPKSTPELIDKVVRQLNVCTMFFQRANFQIQRQPLLKLMESNGFQVPIVDIRTVRKELGQNREFLEQYEELEIEEEQKEWEERVKDLQPMDPDIIKVTLQKLRLKHNLNDSQHIFFASEDSQEVADVLLSYGWLQVPDIMTQVFELKFCLKKRYLFIGPNLQDIQVVNHFPQSKGLTSKYGLSRTMRNCFQTCKVDQNTFFPRCYDLKDELDFEDFLEDFKFTLAESILKKFQHDSPLSQYELGRLLIAVELTRRRMIPMEQKIENIVNKGRFPVVYPDEWIVLKEVNETPLAQSALKRLKIQSLNKPDLTEQIKETLQQLKTWDVQNQIALGLNIWVIKPCGLSRGRGVKYYTDLEELLPYVACSPKVDFVAQKGVENLLIINQKKFDIRQWVLVSSLVPLQVWIYQECYVRFCAEDYNEKNLKNKFAHLTNNSIAKKSEEFGKDQSTQGNMWFQKDLQDYLKNLTGEDIFAQKIKPQIDQVVINTIRSAAMTMDHRRNTFDIFGFDLLIDDTFSVWLIEVNASPTMGKSTPITEKLVSMVLRDTGEFIVEVMYNKKSPKSVGLWRCIYKE